MAEELEAGMTVQVVDVALGAGEKVVNAEHLVTLSEQSVDEVRAEEAGAAGDEDAFAAVNKAGHAGLLLAGSRDGLRARLFPNQ